MAKKVKVYEVRRMRNSGSYHHFFRESGTEAWKYHNWDGPAIEPIEGEITEFKKSYFLYGIEMTKDEWMETRSEREGLPWYKSAALRGTARM
jgi:hypothetical protein|tara:strand:- start:414 stop:689 length:276 start_codon:yes stop_codon:yes gene_type:complete